jgi:transcriptional regulator with XRE-family HTH domain
MFSEFLEGKMDTYDRYVALRDDKGVKDATVARETGIPRSTFTEWKTGRSKPGLEKMKKLADYFGVSVEYLATGKAHYIDDDVLRIAQQLMVDEDLRILFDTTKKVKKEDLVLIQAMAEKLSQN